MAKILNSSHGVYESITFDHELSKTVTCKGLFTRLSLGISNHGRTLVEQNSETNFTICSITIEVH